MRQIARHFLEVADDNDLLNEELVGVMEFGFSTKENAFKMAKKQYYKDKIKDCLELLPGNSNFLVQIPVF